MMSLYQGVRRVHFDLGRGGPANVGRSHIEGPDDAQFGLHQAFRRGDEGVGGKAHLDARYPGRVAKVTFKK